jgi:hypothetical protein
MSEQRSAAEIAVTKAALESWENKLQIMLHEVEAYLECEPKPPPKDAQELAVSIMDAILTVEERQEIPELADYDNRCAAVAAVVTPLVERLRKAEKDR